LQHREGLKAADFGAHSLRAGFLTNAARRGASVFKMRQVSRQKSMDVLQTSAGLGAGRRSVSGSCGGGATVMSVACRKSFWFPNRSFLCMDELAWLVLAFACSATLIWSLIQIAFLF
jgi:hypothetical protein